MKKIMVHSIASLEFTIGLKGLYPKQFLNTRFILNTIQHNVYCKSSQICTLTKECLIYFDVVIHKLEKILGVLANSLLIVKMNTRINSSFEEAHEHWTSLKGWCYRMKVNSTIIDISFRSGELLNPECT